MIGRAFHWFQELSPLQRLAASGAAGGVGLVAVFLAWGVGALIYASVIAAVVVLAVLVFNLALKFMRRRGESEFSQELVQGIKSARKEIGEQFERALAELNSSAVSIYELPWLFFVGEPGGGKTFTIKRSGVDLPVGTEGISGAGGTRNCDFWFTSEAVILDTAGRLTVQEDEVIDREQWNQLLRLLVRHRPNCPINGVIVGIPCTSLLEDDAETRERKGELIRRRLRELQSALKVKFPAFIAILKTDLVLGFEPFFRRLPALERKQLFGWATEGSFERPFDPAVFEAAFDSMCDDLHRWRLKFLNDESVPENADQFYVFPDEFRALKTPIQDYLKKIFVRGPYGQPGFFRGVFLTSSLQEGRAIPLAIRQLLGGLEGTFSGPVAGVPEAESRSSPFFVQDFYNRKVFPEKGLVLRTDRSRLVNALIRHGSLWGGAAVLGLGLLLVLSRYYWVGDQLERPRNDLRELVREERVEGPDHGSLGALKSLGERVQLWSSQDSTAVGTAFEFFFPAPAHDSTLLDELKRSYLHYLRTRHLTPFLRRAQLINQQGPGGGGDRASQETWSDFLDRGDDLVRLVELGLVIENADAAEYRERQLLNFEALKRSYVEKTGAPADGYFDLLVSEYERFLAFGGDPASLRPEGENYWMLQGASATSLETLLLRIHDPAGLEDDSFADELDWWRKLLARCRRFDAAYRGLLELSEADRVSLRSAWGARFEEYRVAQEELERHCAAEVSSDEHLGRRLERQKSAIESFYKRLDDLLATTEERETREFKNGLVAQKERVLKRFEDLDREIRDRVAAFSYLIEGQPPDAPGKKIAGAAKEIARKLDQVNRLLGSEPGELLGDLWAEPRLFPQRLASAYTERRNGISEELKIDRSEWQGERLNRLLHEISAGVLTEAVRQALDGYFERALTSVGQDAALDRRAIDDWFLERSGADTETSGTLLRGPLDAAYVTNARAELAAHLDQLRSFLRQPETETRTETETGRNYLTLDRKSYHDGLDNVLLGYELRYLRYWQEKVGEVRLSPRARDWKGFRHELREGFDQRLPGTLFDRVEGTIRRVREQIEGISLEAKESGHGWAVAMVAYREEEHLQPLFAKLDAFMKFAKKLDDDPVEALRGVRGDRDKWIDGFPRMLRSAQAENEILSKDYFAQELLTLSGAGLELLLRDSQLEFESEWERLVREYGGWMQGKFPFVGDGRVDPEQSCDLIRGLPDTQTDPDRFRELLGNEGAITRFHARYGDCFAESENAVGLRVGSARRDFLEACEGLRAFVIEPDSEHDDSRRVEITLEVPGREREELEAVRARLHPGYSLIFDRLSEIGFTVEKSSKVLRNNLESSLAFSWSLPRHDRSRSRVRFYVPDRADRSRIVHGAPSEPLTAGALCTLDRSVTKESETVAEAPLLFEAYGAWAFPVFLHAYGEPLSRDRKVWIVRYRFPAVLLEGEDERLEVYLRIRLKNELGPLPRWEWGDGTRRLAADSTAAEDADR